MGNFCSSQQNTIDNKDSFLTKSTSPSNNSKGFSSIVQKLKMSKAVFSFMNQKSLSQRIMSQNIIQRQTYKLLSHDFHLQINICDLILHFLKNSDFLKLIEGSNQYELLYFQVSTQAFYIWRLEKAQSYLPLQYRQTFRKFVDFEKEKSRQRSLQKCKKKKIDLSVFFQTAEQSKVAFIEFTLKNSRTFEKKEIRDQIFGQLRTLSFAQKNIHLHQNYFIKLMYEIYNWSVVNRRQNSLFQRRKHFQMSLLFLYLNLLSRGDWNSIRIKVNNHNREFFQSSYVLQYAACFEGSKYIIKTFLDQKLQLIQDQSKFLIGILRQTDS